MANVVKSTDIKMFPSGNRTADVYAGETTEYNLTQIIKSLYKEHSFVVDYDPDSSPKKLSFVIDGYYFEVSNFNDLPSTTTLWAYIFVSTDTSTYDRLRDENGTINLDASNNFKGVHFYSSQQTLSAPGCVTHELEILRNGVVPDSSLVHYNLSTTYTTSSQTLNIILQAK